jgi:glutaconate CoA-transferase, subunit A
VSVLLAEKIMSPEEALWGVPNGAKLGLGGTPLAMNPVSLVAGLILLKRKEFDLVVAPIGGFAADMMIGAGAARSVEFAQIGLEELGMAPNFRKYAQDGVITTLDHT